MSARAWQRRAEIEKSKAIRRKLRVELRCAGPDADLTLDELEEEFPELGDDGGLWLLVHQAAEVFVGAHLSWSPSVMRKVYLAGIVAGAWERPPAP